jgi:N4-gp56 family major capsid protein
MITFGSISQRTAAWASKEMIDHATPIEVLARFAQSKPIPKNTSDNAKFRRPIPFAPATTPLIEGVTPVGHAMQYEDVPVQLQQYGDYVEISDKVVDMAEDPVLKDASALSGEQAAETMEVILWGILRAGTSVALMGGVAARVNINTALTSTAGQNMLRNVTRALKAQRAKFVTEMLTGSANYATQPVAPAFIAFGHTDFEPDLRGIIGWLPVELYGANQKALPYEVGKVDNFRFILSPLLASFPNTGAVTAAMKTTGVAGTNNCDIYPMVFIAKNCYGNCALRGSNAMTPMVLNPGVPRGGDPLGQRGTVGWKSYYAAVRLNEAWMYRVEAAVTI